MKGFSSLKKDFFLVSGLCIKIQHLLREKSIQSKEKDADFSTESSGNGGSVWNSHFFLIGDTNPLAPTNPTNKYWTKATSCRYFEAKGHAGKQRKLLTKASRLWSSWHTLPKRKCSSRHSQQSVTHSDVTCTLWGKVKLVLPPSTIRSSQLSPNTHICTVYNLIDTCRTGLMNLR